MELWCEIFSRHWCPYSRSLLMDGWMAGGGGGGDSGGGGGGGGGDGGIVSMNYLIYNTISTIIWRYIIYMSTIM